MFCKGGFAPLGDFDAAEQPSRIFFSFIIASTLLVALQSIKTAVAHSRFQL